MANEETDEIQLNMTLAGHLMGLVLVCPRFLAELEG